MEQISVDSGSISAPGARASEILSNTPELDSSLGDLHTGVTPTEAQTIASPMTRAISGGLIRLSREEVVARTPRPRGRGKYLILAVALACVGLGVMLRDQLHGLLTGAPPAPEHDALDVMPTLIEPVRIAVDPPAAPVAPAAVTDAMAVAEHDPAAPAPGELPGELPGIPQDTLPGELPGTPQDTPPGGPANGATGAVEAVPAAVEPATETDEPSPTGADSGDSVSPSDKPDRPRKKRRREPRSRPERPTLDIGKNP